MKTDFRLLPVLIAGMALTACVSPLGGDIDGSKINAGYMPGFSTGAFSLSIPFAGGTSSSYDLSSSTVELSGGVCRLKPAEQSDSSSNTGSTSGGFLDGTLSGVKWDSANQVVRLDTDTNGARMDASWAPEWSSLAYYWTLDGTLGAIANNTSIPAAVGTAATAKNSGGTGMSYVTGQVSQGISFDGTDDSISLGAGTTVFPTAITEGTISAWVNGTNSTSDRRIINFRTTNGSTFAILGGRVSGAFSAFVKNSSDSLVQIDSAAGLYTTGVWHHLVLTAKDGEAVFYVDGIQAGSSTDVSAAYTFATDAFGVYIGAYTGSSSFFKGSVDDVAIWQKALTAAEVRLIYDRQSAKYSGTLTSKVMNAYSSQEWKSIAASTTLPFYKELPGSTGSETSSSYSSIGGGLMSGLVAYWPLNETAFGTATGGADFQDRSGQSNSLVQSVGTVATLAQPGMLGYSIARDSTTTKISAASSSTLNFGTSTDFTLSSWVKLAASSTGSNQGILSKSLYQLLYLASSHSIRAYVYDGGTHFCTVDGSLSIADGEWHLVTAVYHRGNTCTTADIEIYVDGRKDTGASVTNATETTDVDVDSTSEFELGSRQNALPLSGNMDDAAVWARALSANELLELYRRAANRLKYQVRSCASSDCSDQDALTSAGQGWKGPGNSQLSYFSELQNNSTIDSSGNPTGSVSTNPLSLLFATFTTAGTGLSVSNNQYFQYRAVLESDDANTLCTYGGVASACSPELRSVTIGPDHYDTTVQSVASKASIGHLYRTLESGSFVETLGPNGCSSGAHYALSSNGSDYYYWDGSAWASSSDYSTASAASTISANLASFPSSSAGTGTIQIKTFLKSDGTSACEVDSLALDGAL